MPSGRSDGASKETTPMADSMPKFSNRAQPVSSLGQAAMPANEHIGDLGGPPQGPPTPGPRIAGYSSSRGDINVHTVSSIPPVHPPVFSDMREHTRRRSPAIIKAYRDKVTS